MTLYASGNGSNDPAAAIDVIVKGWHAGDNTGANHGSGPYTGTAWFTKTSATTYAYRFHMQYTYL
jgi:hypothetical protein